MSEASVSKILIVDDVPRNVQLLAEVISGKGYEIAAAMDGKEALQTAKEFKPDLILLDIMMPVMDGIETIRELKKIETLAETPVIFLTAKSRTEDVTRGFDEGAVDYITKPFHTSELLARIRTHLELKEKRQHIKLISEERAELLHILSHDLLNPASAVAGAVELYKIDDMSKKDAIDVIENASKNILEIIALVREIRAIDSGKKVLKMSEVNLTEAVNEAIMIISGRFKSKNIEIKNLLPADIMVVAEKASLINSVINNILSNALKFSYENETVEITSEQTDDDFIALTIKDTGRGIPASMMDELFSPLARISRSGTAGESGTGFGMPLIKKTVEAMNGSVEIESISEDVDKADRGTAVTVFLEKA